MPGYKAKYIQVSKIRTLLTEGDQKLRVSGDGKDALYEHLDHAIEESIAELIKKLPRVSRGDNMGKLKRITIMPKDFEVQAENPQADVQA